MNTFVGKPPLGYLLIIRAVVLLLFLLALFQWQIMCARAINKSTFVLLVLTIISLWPLYFGALILYMVPKARYFSIKKDQLIIQNHIFLFKFEKAIKPKKIFFARVLSGGKRRRIYKTIIIKYGYNKKLMINELTCSQIEALFSWLKENLYECQIVNILSNRVFKS